VYIKLRWFDLTENIWVVMLEGSVIWTKCGAKERYVNQRVTSVSYIFLV
jgi:hypothetical protein